MRLKLLPVVKAYPVIDPSSQTEAVCVAGITMEEPHRWIRLFPLDYRGLQRASRFKKYEVIELEAGKSSKGLAPRELFPRSRLDRGQGVDLHRRRDMAPTAAVLDAIEDASMCEIQRRQKTERKTLGVFRPAEVMDLTVTPAEKGFAESQRALLNQASLFGDRAGDDTRKALEPLPVKAKFSYRCSDPTCTKHAMSLIDWELGALYRSLAEAGDDGTRSTRRLAPSFSSNTVAPATRRASLPAACSNTPARS